MKEKERAWGKRQAASPTIDIVSRNTSARTSAHGGCNDRPGSLTSSTCKADATTGSFVSWDQPLSALNFHRPSSGGVLSAAKHSSSHNGLADSLVKQSKPPLEMCQAESNKLDTLLSCLLFSKVNDGTPFTSPFHSLLVSPPNPLPTSPKDGQCRLWNAHHLPSGMLVHETKAMIHGLAKGRQRASNHT